MTAPSPPSHAGFANPPPQSPARSNSTSSVATQSSAAQPGVTTNPSLIVGSMPSITATNSGKITGVPLTTPPETPSTAATQPSGVKREASDGDKDGSQPKKRRIAPTLVEEKKP
ncbi:hypothetical protein BN1708_012555 [Verticillium longisporum]|uniref:Uncharacterized protein n=2 Tax=Verticillium longisporum TaxID=100787 RepID=A0A0G4LB59_VERLO|nr:hypothetical protein BN1708_012555 [Verticillium longisporum]